MRLFYFQRCIAPRDPSCLAVGQTEGAKPIGTRPRRRFGAPRTEGEVHHATSQSQARPVRLWAALAGRIRLALPLGRHAAIRLAAQAGRFRRAPPNEEAAAQTAAQLLAVSSLLVARSPCRRAAWPGRLPSWAFRRSWLPW